MTSEQYSALASFIFLGAFALGVRASYRLTRRYVDARSGIDERNRPILLVIVYASWIITAASAWIGGLSVIRLLLETAISWTPPITLFIAFVVVLIPVALDLAITRVARRR